MSWQTIPEEKRKWWALAAMTTSVSMIFVDVTVLPVAMPTISSELNFSALSLQWILNAYTLSLTVLVLAGGRLSDMWGLKNGFCIGLSLFALASMLCGICNTSEWMIFSRALQGAGGALLIPSTQGILIGAFPPHQRGKAIGLFVSIGSIFLALGPLIGGSLTQYLSWRYVFWINLPIAAIGMALTLLTVPPVEKRRQPFDFVGFLTWGMGASAIVIAVMNTQLWGWLSPMTLFLLALGVFMITVLVRSERKISHPFIDLEIIRKKSFQSSSTAIFCAQFLAMVTVFWAIYFQDVLLYSPSKAGVIVFISNAPVLFAAPLAGFLADRLGPRIPVAFGFSLIAFSLIWFLFYRTTNRFDMLLPALIPFGFGIPLVFTPSMVSMMNEVPAEKRGNASGLYASGRQFGATLGLAVFGTMFSQWYHWRFTRGLQSNTLTEKIDPTRFEGLLSHKPSAVLAIKEQTDQVGTYVQKTMVQAYTSAFDLINLVAALIAIVGIILAVKLLKNKPNDHHHHHHHHHKH